MKMRHRGVSLLKGGAFILYALLKLLPKQHKLVLISRLQNYSSIDFQYIAKTAATIDPSLKVVALNHKMDNRLTHMLAILQEMYHLATAESCVIESYVISVSILKHRKSLIIVQLWHALGAVKAFGHMTIGKPEGSSAAIARLMNMHKNYTFVAAGAPPTIPIYAKAFNVSEDIIKPIGMPRVDYLLHTDIQDSNKQAVYKRFALATDKKVIVYAPTFRKKSRIPYDELIAHVDTSRYTLIIKQHVHDKATIAGKDGVIVSRSFELMELLPAADYVITDYSAAVFEAALLQKPLFFWQFDEQRYAKQRGFSMNYKQELPGYTSPSAKEVLDAIDRDDYNTDQIAAFAKRYVTRQDGSCTRALFELLGVAA